jgi:anaerobic magnesium-protoporphyrin IX monomethyl ester cyclase
MKTDKNPYIVFVYPPANPSPDQRMRTHFRMCLGGAYIIAYLVQKGFTAHYFLTDEPVNMNECVARIAAMKPRMVGFTVDNSNYFLCQFIARSIKEAVPGIIIIFGGLLPSLQPEVILKNNPFVDICARNESEETCFELLCRLDDAGFDLKKASLDGVKGISYRLESQVFTNPDRNAILADRSIADVLDKYPSPYLTGIARSHRMGIITARGCNQHCVFCACPVLSNRIIATHSIHRVIEELQYIAENLVQNKTAIVPIFDDTFTLMPNRALEICHKIVENKIKLSLACTTRCDKVDEELLDAMKEAGFSSVEFSLESAVPRILRTIGKVQSPNTKNDNHFEKETLFIEKFKKYVSYAKKIGFGQVYTSIMVGLPTETQQEAKQTLDLIRSLNRHIDLYGHNIFQARPGTPIFSYCDTYGVQVERCENQVHYKTIHTFDTGQIPLAPKSNVEIMGIDHDINNIKSMALELSKTSNHKTSYINKVILCADVITKELILWLQKYLAINGSFIQIYSDSDSAKQYHRENDRVLEQYKALTTDYHAYYQSSSQDGIITLTPFRTVIWGQQCGVTIQLVNTELGLSSSASQIDIDPFHSICIDRVAAREDALQLHRVLRDLSTTDDIFAAPLYPYMSSLCRWEKGEANCSILETLIVDSKNNIKPCWNGEPIGRVGMPFPSIKENLKKIHLETREKRDCQQCKQQKGCSKCIFPQPLSENEYCHLKQAFNAGEPAGLIRTIDTLKDLKLSDVTIYHGES